MGGTGGNDSGAAGGCGVGVDTGGVGGGTGAGNGAHDATSQATYGTGNPDTGRIAEIISDTSISDGTTADQRGNKELADKKDYKLTATSDEKTVSHSVKIKSSGLFD